MKNPILTILIVLSMFLFSCQSDDIGDNEKPEEIVPKELRFTEKIEEGNAFTFDLLRATYKDSDDKNIFISPLSVSLAFQMVLNGAEGKTKTEILEALRAKGYSVEAINEYSKNLCLALAPTDTSIQLNIVNSIWYHKMFQVKNKFIEANKTYYDAEVNVLDFTSADAVHQINNWCARKTNNKIEKILQTVSPDDVMYLLNAVYFKGYWAARFSEEYTKPDDFFEEDGTVQKVNMMRQESSYPYFEDEYCQYLELRYASDYEISPYSAYPSDSKRFSMVLMLPNEGKSIDDVVQTMDNKRWGQMAEFISSNYKNTDLRLPRFKFGCSYNMAGSILPEMGMKIPFTGKADFSGISDNPLFISQVIHKSYIDVNEHGTEAAAVTLIGMDGSAGPPPEPIDYIVNKPFLLAIREKTTGAILFIGKIGEIK